MEAEAATGMGRQGHWVNPSGQPVETCTIITTDANSLVNELHDRMPVILEPSDYGANVIYSNGQQNPH